MLCDGLAARASAILLDVTATSVAVRHMVDGVWMPQEPIEREGADPALAGLKGELALRLGDRMAETCDPLPERTADW